VIWWLAGCADPASLPPVVATPQLLAEQCETWFGEPRVMAPAPDVFVAVGYDLANTVVLRGPEGLVVVDPGMSPARATAAREALERVVSGPVRAVIYTHSHLDHVGAASVWVEDGTEVWATATWQSGFFDQYGTFLPSESARAMRQFGRDLPAAEHGCSAIGARPDVGAPVGVVLPTHTFEDHATLEVAGLSLELLALPGETADHLAVVWPARGAILPGDNWYASFPNLYTIRGTRPRPVDGWIRSLDTLRALDAEVMVPSHTLPVVGRDAVRQALVAHRDAIQSVRDAVVRGVNRGERREELVDGVQLPPELAALPALQETYGRVDWSARAIADASVGWFDGRAAGLFPLPGEELARRSVAAMGGSERVRAEALARLETEPGWALHLLTLLEDQGESGLDAAFATAYRAQAATVPNANGRAYLLVAAGERERGAPLELQRPELSDGFVDGLPLRMLFDVMASRLRPEDAVGVEAAVAFDLGEATFVVTVRHGIAEVVEGAPLPGTPPLLATLHADGRTWRRLALERESAVTALADGRLRIDGDAVGLWRFLGRFDQGLAPPPTRLP
jgi:alkyl sulfatase BDS1-like metallo-beta-lactamase superfamily hydrolase